LRGAGLVCLKNIHIFSRPITIKQSAKGKAGSRYLIPSWAGLIGRDKMMNGVMRPVKISIVLILLRRLLL